MFPFLKLFVFALFPLFIILVTNVIHFKRLSSDTKPHKNPPPSPSKLPFIGNFHQLALRNHRSLMKLEKKHGPLMRVHLGSVHVLVASSVDAAREIMKTHELMFLDRLKSSNISKITYNYKDVTFSPYGEYWKSAKSLLVHHLLSHKKVISYQQVREEEVTLMMDRIGESCGSIVNFSELMISHTNNVLCRVALGRKFEIKEVKNFVEDTVVLTSVFRFGDYIPYLSWMDKLRGLDSNLENYAKHFDHFLEGVIEEHLIRRRRRESTETKSCMVDKDKCFIDILLEEKDDSFYFQRDEIKAILMNVFVAGTNQPFTSLEWTLSELVRNPRTMKKLQQEVKEIAQGKPMVTEDDVGKLHYMKAVIKESLRLHPPLPLIPIELTQDVKLMGYDIEAPAKVLINIWAIGRDPTIWEEPEEFKPERFLNSPIDYKGSYFELLPHGTGRRGCPGIQYAETINTLTLANLVYKFDVTLPNGVKVEDMDMKEGIGAFVHRKNPLFLVATQLS